MTFEECQAALAAIRSHQGTEHPLVQVKCADSVVRGRLNRADTDRPCRRQEGSPYGVLVLEQPGLVPGPPTFIQIANIPEGGLQELATCEPKHVNQLASARN
jgi:hypothetical protein